MERDVEPQILQLCAWTTSRIEESIQDVCGSIGVDRRINQRA